VRAVGDFEQQAAIKTLRADLLNPEAVRRFQRERRILARFDHPNIARLLDGGEDDPAQPYLAMEFVEGVPIDKWAAGRSIPEQLDVFAQVCSALAYAHQHLVVHCDLKPSNILVTAAGQAKLLDFGIARLLSPDAEAGTAQHLTPQYASPEQLRNLPLSTSSDIYSLGVVLYKILTGRLPYAATTTKSTDPVALAREICEAAPRELGPAFPEDLNAIVSKALAKDPAERYPSALAFARDLQNFRSGKSVEARPLSRWREVTRFLVRHRWASLATAAALIALFVTTAWALRERNRVQALLLESRQMSGSLIWEVERALTQESPTEARRILLERTGEHLNRLSRSTSLDRDLAFEIAESYRLLADAQNDKGDKRSGESHERALRILESWRGTSQADFIRAKVLIDQRTEQSLGEAETILNSIQGIAPHLLLSAQSLAHEFQGVRIVGKGDYEGTRLRWQKALKLAEESRRLHPREVANSQVARMYRRMGAISAQLKDFKTALDHQLASVAVEETAHGQRPGLASASNLSTSLSEVAFSLRRLNREADALTYIDRAIALRRDLFERDSNNQYYRYALSNSLSMKGSVLQNLKRHREAQAFLEEAVSIATPMHDGGLHLAQVLSSLVEWEMARPATRTRGIAHARQAVAIFDQLKAKNKFPAFKQTMYDYVAGVVRAK
jgi:serine/threonine protein kinase